MRPVIQTLSAAGYAPWVPLDYLEAPFAVGLGGILSSNGNLTWGVQHTFDDTGPNGSHPVAVTQSVSTTATVTDFGDQTWTGTPGHGLSVGDSVVLQSTGIGIDGTYQVASVISQTQYTVTVGVSQTASSVPGCRVNPLRVFSHATLTGLTARQDGNYAFPPRACRLICSAYTAGYVQLCILQGSSA